MPIDLGEIIPILGKGTPAVAGSYLGQFGEELSRLGGTLGNLYRQNAAGIAQANKNIYDALEAKEIIKAKDLVYTRTKAFNDQLINGELKDQPDYERWNEVNDEYFGSLEEELVPYFTLGSAKQKFDEWYIPFKATQSQFVIDEKRKRFVAETEAVLFSAAKGQVQIGNEEGFMDIIKIGAKAGIITADTATAWAKEMLPLAHYHSVYQQLDNIKGEDGNTDLETFLFQLRSEGAEERLGLSTDQIREMIDTVENRKSARDQSYKEKDNEYGKAFIQFYGENINSQAAMMEGVKKATKTEFYDSKEKEHYIDVFQSRLNALQTDPDRVYALDNITSPLYIKEYQIARFAMETGGQLKEDLPLLGFKKSDRISPDKLYYSVNGLTGAGVTEAGTVYPRFSKTDAKSFLGDILTERSEKYNLARKVIEDKMSADMKALEKDTNKQVDVFKYYSEALGEFDKYATEEGLSARDLTDRAAQIILRTQLKVISGKPEGVDQGVGGGAWIKDNFEDYLVKVRSGQFKGWKSKTGEEKKEFLAVYDKIKVASKESMIKWSGKEPDEVHDEMDDLGIEYGFGDKDKRVWYRFAPTPNGRSYNVEQYTVSGWKLLGPEMQIPFAERELARAEVSRQAEALKKAKAAIKATMKVDMTQYSKRGGKWYFNITGREITDPDTLDILEAQGK